MDSFTAHQFINSRSLQYTYYSSLSSNSTAGGPTLLLLHGFPDSATVWSFVVPYLLTLGLRILIPDLLGYAGTSKPWDPFILNSKAMADDLTEILIRENVTKVIPIGHDWGGFLAHRYYLWHPENVSAVVISSITTDPVIRAPIDIDQQAAINEQRLGYPLRAYYKFFAGPDAAELMSGHPESFAQGGYGVDNALKQTFCYRDGLRDWLLADKRRQLQEWALNTSSYLEANAKNLQSGGYRSPLTWYRAYVENYHYQVEKDLPDDVDVVKAPLLFVGGATDPLAPPQLYDEAHLRGIFADFTKTVLDSGHFLPLEQPRDFAQTIIGWLDSKNLTARPRGRNDTVLW